MRRNGPKKISSPRSGVARAAVHPSFERGIFRLDELAGAAALSGIAGA
jgi:hypothetical protein